MKAAVKSMCAAIAAVFTATVLAAVPSSITKFVPEMMNYQGYLANPSSGAAYTDGIYTLDCRLYRSASGGTAIWGARYSVYVKGGYFNIMLGDSSGQAIKSTVTGTASTTYSPTELWKALWYDSAVSEKNNLWLGVTPHQGSNGAAVQSLSEISPRQQLLAAPYAFRAQAAEYAEQSIGAFKVNGNLTVTGSLSLPSSFQFGHIKDTSTQLTLGGTSNSSTNPNIYSYTKYLYLYSYYDMYFTPYSGNVKFTIPNGKSFIVLNNNFAVTNSATTMKSSSKTDIAASTTVSISAGSSMTLKASSSLSALPATNSYFYGQGKVSWKAPGSTSTVRPMKLKTVTVTVPVGTNTGRYQFAWAGSSSTGGDYADYVWTVAGVRLGTYQSADATAPNSFYCTKGSSDEGDYWAVYITFDKNLSFQRTYKVELLGINRAFCDDNR